MNRPAGASADGGPRDWLWQSPQHLPGIGPRRAAALRRSGIEDAWDLLHWLPRAYRDYRAEQQMGLALPGVEAAFRVRVGQAPKRIRGRFWRAVVEDASTAAEVYWFSRYLPGPAQQLAAGQEIWIVGRPERRRKGPVFSHPRIFGELDELHIEPVYRGATWLSGALGRVATAVAEPLRAADPMPAALQDEFAVPGLAEALLEIHAPGPEVPAEALMRFASPGFRRVAADTLLVYFLGLGLRRRALRAEAAPASRLAREELERLHAALPFELTEDQRSVVREILRELQQKTPMYRLVQGDVGSGKTMVALIAAAAVAMAGGQAAILAPTEILAAQHARLFDQVLTGLGLRIGLLTGSAPAIRKKELRHFLAAGNLDIIIGTHALLQESVRFADLRLVVIDEEQRYGVQQRSQLRGKGGAPHTLLLSATPIPRSLALTLLGETDVSNIREKPAGRAPVETEIVRPDGKRAVLEHIRRELDAGHKVFFLYPRVEADEDGESRSVVSMHVRLAEYFGADRVGLLHGRLPGEEKDRMLRHLRDGRIQILVSTSVIEVGVDVPDATVLVIAHPEAYGLSQLHQIRGRIGRGSLPGTCYLLVEEDVGDEALARLEVLTRSQDGFEIAEADLELRGAGSMLGTRQSGLPDLHPSLLRRFQDLAGQVRAAADRLLDADPQLLDPAHAGLREILIRKWDFPIGESTA